MEILRTKTMIDSDGYYECIDYYYDDTNDQIKVYIKESNINNLPVNPPFNRVLTKKETEDFFTKWDHKESVLKVKRDIQIKKFLN